MNRTTIDLWVGIFVALGAAALVFLSLQVASFTTGTRGETYELNARFADIGGLKVKAPVKSAGVVVGRVTHVALDKQMFQAVVSVSVEKEFEFPTDTLARIMTSGILGDQYISLEPGSEPDNLKDGDTLENTSDAFVLEKLISKFVFSRTSDGDGKKDEGKGKSDDVEE
jgi:phospholipid/cholesterol/gamma-HCH transport system substrate-binding protein